MIAVGRAVMVEHKRILAGADVAAIDAAQAEGFQMPDQGAVAGTGLGKAADAAKVRDQRHHCCPWRRVEIGLAALEVGSLAHQPAPRVSDISDLEIDRTVSWVRLTVPVVRLCGLMGETIGLLQSRG